MPIVGDGSKGNDRNPKYFATLVGFDWTMFDYGDEPFCLVGVTDISPVADTTLTNNADVFKMPDNLDTTMGNTNTRNTVRTRLEAVDMPGTWVQTTSTFREVVRFIGGVCKFAQVFQGLSGIPSDRWFANNRTLDNTFGDLGQRAQNMLVATSDSLGFDRSALTATTTLRQFLKSAGDQYVATRLADLSLEGSL